MESHGHADALLFKKSMVKLKPAHYDQEQCFPAKGFPQKKGSRRNSRSRVDQQGEFVAAGSYESEIAVAVVRKGFVRSRGIIAKTGEIAKPGKLDVAGRPISLLADE